MYPRRVFSYIQCINQRRTQQNTAKYKSNIQFSVDKKNQQMSLFVFFISLLIVAQHVSGNHVPIIRG
jgi:hypothetical protein